MSQNFPIVDLENLNVRVGDKSILEEITFTLPNGGMTSILGPNGAGKSTLLKTFTGIVAPSSGKIEILGMSLTSSLPRRKIRNLRAQVGQVFQGLHLVPRLSVFENILIGRLSTNHSFSTWARKFSARDHAVAKEVMDTVNITHRAHDRVDRLSGGEKQKVAMARALAQEPKLLLADEPTASLDPRAADEFALLLHRLVSEKSITVVTVVHTLSLLNQLQGRVIGLKKGRVQFDLPFNEVKESLVQNLYCQEEMKGTP